MTVPDTVAAAPRTENEPCRYGTLRFPADDIILGTALRRYGEWAQLEIDLLLQLVGAGATLVDVGAFVGTHTLAFAQHAGASCTVHAFEPHPWYFALLTSNLRANGVHNVLAHPCALADKRVTLAFTADGGETPRNFGNARLVDAAAPTDHSVTAMPLDSLALAECDLLKVDVEGMEAQVVQGAIDTLRRCQPFVYCECNSLEEGWPVVRWLQGAGFACWGHNFTAFNPANFKGSAENVFGPAREVGLLFVPQARRAAAASLLADAGRLAPIERLDDLALCLLRKPQYKAEVLARGAAASALGTDFVGDEAIAREVVELRDALRRTQAALDEAQALAWERAGQLDGLHRQLAQTQAAHEFSEQLAHTRAREIDALNQEVARLRQEATGLREETTSSRNGSPVSRTPRS